MGSPPIRYTTTSDGKRIAYSVAGRGPTLVWLPNLFHHVELVEGGRAAILHKLRERFRVVLYDERGQGMSSRGLSADHTMGHWELDLAAVMDAVGADEAIIMGTCHSGHVATRFAAANPERVLALVLVSSCVRQHEWGPASYWETLPYENWDLFLTKTIPADTPLDQQAAFLAALKSMVTPEEYRVFEQVVTPSTIEAEASILRVPALVIHPRNYTMLSVDQSAELAALIPGARFATIGGTEDGVFGDNSELVAAINDFVADVVPIGGVLRSLAPSLTTIPEELTPREVDVLNLIASGSSNQEIADELVISVRTVERHITNIYSKIGARGRADATAFALRRRIA